MNGHRRRQTGEGGFTLIELLMAIVIVGILFAVAVVGVAGLQDKGQTAACAASLDAATSASEMYYSVSGGKFPQSFSDLTNPPQGKPLLDPSPGVVTSATTLQGKGGIWTVTLRPGATPAQRTTFTGCSVAAVSTAAH
jgi:prepilin-type N-terminal cleavage/methylation domain-containing protein